MSQDDVIKNLRSCLISCKGGIKLDNLSADYRTVAGEPLPFRQFGYSSVEAFVRNIPDVTLTKKCGELYVEAVPSKSTAHLTKLVSRQKSARRRIRPQPKKWTPPRRTKGFSPGFKNNNSSSGLQPNRNNYVSSSNSFTRSTPGKSNLYTDFCRPLMETIVQRPLPQNITPSTPKLQRLIEVAEPVNQSYSSNNCNLRLKVLNDNTAASSVINQKPKTVELKTSKLSERLKVTPPVTPSIPINNYNSSGTTTPVPSILNIPQSIAPPSQILDPRKELEIRANVLKLPSPIYKTYLNKEKHAKITIYATVKIGAHIFEKSYPVDAATEEEAEKIVARKALKSLAEESSNHEVTTIDTELIKRRILNIVTGHQSGVFMHLLPDCYNEKYGEALPHNWQKIIDDCIDIIQEKGVGDSTILCLISPSSKRSESNSTLSSKISSENIFPSNKKIQLSPIGSVAPDILPIPDAAIWLVCATCVINTVEIWVRLYDQNDEFVDMTNEMMRHYDQMSERTSPAVCVPNDFYVVLEENYWHRVQCIDFDDETRMATVFFIDEGLVERYKPDVLHPLDRKFCVLPCQAIRVGLYGLKDFRDCDQIVPEIENYLLIDQVFNVRVHGRDADEYGSYVTVTFYDTSKDEDIDINQVLANKILENFAVAFKMRRGQLTELYVTHVDEQGKVYAQINSFAKTVLNGANMSTNNATRVEGITFTKTYLAKWNSQWYRARAIDIFEQQGEVALLLIDIGRTVRISRNNLFDIDKASQILQCIPQQAMQIFLHNIDQLMYERLTRFRELVSDTDLLLAKVIEISMSGVPVVEIFKRIGPSNMLVSINTSLIYEDKLSKVNEDGNNNNKPKKRLDRGNSRGPELVEKLNPPVISDIGQYFDVHITLVSHPGHFIVQPLNNADELKAMMNDLQNCYEVNNDPPLEYINEGKLYAGKYRDEWYRVYVTHIINDSDVSAYFCDYGDVMVISRDNLRLLKSKFLKLPYQAVKAKLVGIEPINVDWTVTDCIKFKDLVLEKNFVSVIHQSIFDDLSPVNGTMLGLRLIDVSTERDIYIDKLLVEERRAKYIEGFLNEELPS
ncbi:tudor domain-containing protein 7 isoform X3 [Solenopsis invicta]|uniref:tudor domain-containing protein 7 isoform X3 n=1 Tax=Solenopsis invicta TaxID=13686 RepID=UPI000595D0D3|nr:tudor domain-containing protein 7 isoform X3 [Solenopsis invicta]